MKTTRLVITLLIILLLLGGGYILYFFLLEEGAGGEEGPRFAVPFLFPGEESPPDGFPAGGGGGTAAPDENGGLTILPRDSMRGPLTQIAAGPVSGYTTLEEGAAGTVVRFIEKQNGHIVDANILTGAEEKVSNKTIPGIQEVVWTASGNPVVRYLAAGDIIKTSALVVKTGAGESEKLEEYLFETPLRRGDRGADVRELQKTINAIPDIKVSASGPGSPGEETDFFGPATEKAVISFQLRFPQETLEQDGLSGPTMVVDGATLAFINEMRRRIVITQETQQSGVLIQEPEMREMPDNILAVAAHPTNDGLFVLSPSPNGSFGEVATLDKESGREIFSSPLKSWTADWPAESLITLTTKPSGESPGHMFLLSTQGSELTRVLSGIPGLRAVMDKSGKRIFYSGYDAPRRGLQTGFMNMETKDALTLSVETLAEKCVWSHSDKNILYCAIPQEVPRGTYPDHWYQGRVSFTDRLWRLDFSSPDAPSVLLTNFEDVSSGMDLTNLVLNESGSHIMFTNKKDGSLWSFELPAF